MTKPKLDLCSTTLHQEMYHLIQKELCHADSNLRTAEFTMSLERDSRKDTEKATGQEQPSVLGQTVCSTFHTHRPQTCKGIHT